MNLQEVGSPRMRNLLLLSPWMVHPDSDLLLVVLVLVLLFVNRHVDDRFEPE